MNIGTGIRIARKRAGISQRELVARIDGSSGYVSLVESGARSPSQDTVSEIAAAIGVHPLELYVLATIEDAERVLRYERHSLLATLRRAIVALSQPSWPERDDPDAGGT